MNWKIGISKGLPGHEHNIRMLMETIEAVHKVWPQRLPLADLVFNRLQAGVAKGRGELDWTGLALGARDDAGL